jgi:hypothetical protein
MSEEETPNETKAQLAERLKGAVQEALGSDALPNPDGWRIEGVKLVAMRGGDKRLDENVDPALVFALPDRTLTIAVLQTDPSKSAFRRTPRYDIMYLSKDSTSDQETYGLNQAMLESFAAWVDAWDRGVPVEPPSPGPGADGDVPSGEAEAPPPPT